MQLCNWITLTPVFLKCLGKLPFRHLWYLAQQFRNENPHHHNGRLHINTFFPPYPSRAFDRFLDAAIKRDRLPYSTYFAVTDKCPYQCPHCSYGLHTPGNMNTSQALETIRQIKELGSITIGLTGGEPLVRDDITDLVKAIGDDTAGVIFTTGYHLTNELAARLKNSGLDCLMIGLESDDPREHDKIRGTAGSFEEGIKAINTSLQAGLYTAISTVGTRSKIANGNILRMAQLAAKYGVHEFRILEPIPTGRLYHQKEEILSPQDSNWLVDFHKQWNRKNHGPAVCSFSHLESSDMFGCGAGFHHLFVDALGNVCPCDLTPLSFGNLLDEPLEIIWNRMARFFDLPRCRCLMKELAGTLDRLPRDMKLPLNPDESVKLCQLLRPDKKLPRIYRNLFKGHRPSGPPLTPP